MNRVSDRDFRDPDLSEVTSRAQGLHARQWRSVPCKQSAVVDQADWIVKGVSCVEEALTPWHLRNPFIQTAAKSLGSFEDGLQFVHREIEVLIEMMMLTVALTVAVSNRVVAG